MAAYVIVFASSTTVEAAVIGAWTSEGHVVSAKPTYSRHESRVTIDLYVSGCVVKLGPGTEIIESRLEKALAERLLAAGVGAIFLDADLDVSRLAEWDASGRRVQDIRNPDWSDGQRRYENGDERVGRWHLEEIAETRLGARNRGASITLVFEAKPLRPIDELLRVIADGGEVAEMLVQGNPAFRFQTKGGTRTVVTSETEAKDVRTRIKSRA